MNEIKSAQFMWDSTANRHYDRAFRNLSDVQERIGWVLRTLEQVDPNDLHGSTALPGSSDVRNMITDLIEVVQRLELLDLLRDFQPVYRPTAAILPPSTLRTCRKCGRERSVDKLAELDNGEWMCAYGNCPEGG